MSTLKPIKAWLPIRKRDMRKQAGAVLVTNNLDARDSFGKMSRLWLTSLIQWAPLDGYCAYSEDRLIRNLTHWRPAIPEEWIERKRRKAGK